MSQRWQCGVGGCWLVLSNYITHTHTHTEAGVLSSNSQSVSGCTVLYGMLSVPRWLGELPAYGTVQYLSVSQWIDWVDWVASLLRHLCTLVGLTFSPLSLSLSLSLSVCLSVSVSLSSFYLLRCFVTSAHGFVSTLITKKSCQRTSVNSWSGCIQFSSWSGPQYGSRNVQWNVCRCEMGTVVRGLRHQMP